MLIGIWLDKYVRLSVGGSLSGVNITSKSYKVRIRRKLFFESFLF